YNFTECWYGQLFVTLEHDLFKDLVLRTKAGPAIGYRFIKEDDKALMGELGAAYVNEDFKGSDDDNDFIALKAAEELNWDLSKTQSLHERVEYYPNTEKFSDYLIHAELTIRNFLTGGFFVDIGIQDDYDHEPADDTKQNDFKALVALGYKF